MEPLESLELASHSRTFHGKRCARLVAARVQVLNYSKVALGSCLGHSALGAALYPVLVEPPDQLEMLVLGSCIHGFDRAAFRSVGVQPLYRF